MVTDIAKTLTSFKANKVELYDLTSKNMYAKYILICSTQNEETCQDFCMALESYIIEKYSAHYKSREGFHKGNWIILDYDNFVVHIMTESQREKYKIDGLYKDFKKINL